MGLISRLTGEIDRNKRIAERLESNGLGNSDAARTARSNIKNANKKLREAKGEQEGQRTSAHP